MFGLTSAPRIGRYAKIGSSFRVGSTKAFKYPRPLKTTKSGIDIMHDPLWNKGMAFDMNERDRLGLRGLLPPALKSTEEQIARVLRHVNCPSIQKYVLFLFVMYIWMIDCQRAYKCGKKLIFTRFA